MNKKIAMDYQLYPSFGYPEEIYIILV